MKEREGKSASMSPAEVSILVVEDDADIREILEILLGEEGYTGTFASSLDEALARIDSARYDLIVSDLLARQPTDPLSSVERLRERAAPTPVGLITGWKLAEEEVKRRGFAFLLRKPFGLDDLLAHIAAGIHTQLSEEQQHLAKVARHYFAALGARDWDGLCALCADDVTYELPGVSSFAAEVRGKQAFRAFTEATFAQFPDAYFDDVRIYSLPKGLAARYEGHWVTPSGAERQSGAVIFHFAGDHIAQIGVRLNEAYLQARVERDSSEAPLA
jgi:CheY-like chemotaxis protein